MLALALFGLALTQAIPRELLLAISHPAALGFRPHRLHTTAERDWRWPLRKSFPYDHQKDGI